MSVWQRNMIRLTFLLAVILTGPGAWGQQKDEAWIAAAASQAEGILSHSVRSPRQRAATELRVLLPDEFDAAKRYQVLYVLPVEAARGRRYGDGLLEMMRRMNEEKHVTFIFSTHDKMVMEYARRLVVIKDGRLADDRVKVPQRCKSRRALESRRQG